MRRVSILVSGKEFLWVTFKKSIPLLLFASLDIFDIWDRYIGPRILELTGRDIALPSNWLLVLLGLGILCSAILTYHELTKRKVALEADLEPTVSIDDTPLLRVWNDKKHGLSRLYSIAVTNPSARPLRDVSVLLTDIDPEVPNLDWLPIPLRIKHDKSTPPRESIAINPRGVRHIDLVAKPNRRSEIELCHTISGVQRQIPVQRYVLTVRVEGESVAVPKEAKFLVKVGSSGEIVCFSGQFVDLNKGLLEYKRDGEAFLKRTTKTLELITAATTNAGAAIQMVTSEVTAVSNDPISWIERRMAVTTIQGRIIRRSRAWSSLIDDVTTRLEGLADNYEGQASEAISNYIGFFETASEIELSVVKAIDSATAGMEVAITGTRNWLSKVIELRAKRLTTSIGHSLLRLERVIRRLLSTHERMRDGFIECKGIAEGKIKP